MDSPASRLSQELAADRAKVKRELTLTGVTGLGLAAGLAGGWAGGEGAGLATAAGALWTVGYAVAYVAGGTPAARDALRRLFARRRLSIDLLMVLAAVAAALVGEVRDGAILLFLFSLAESLEGYAMGTTKRAVVALMDLRPETANLVVDGRTTVVPVADVQVGQVILVRPGERVPPAGVVRSGAGHVDQSPLTGGSVPVDKEPGGPLCAGSVNGT